MSDEVDAIPAQRALLGSKALREVATWSRRKTEVHFARTARNAPAEQGAFNES